MRSIDDTRKRWETLFHDNDTTSDLRSALQSEQGGNLCNDGLRSICWKAFLLFDDLDRTQWPQKITDARCAYSALRDHLLKYIEHPDDLQSTIDPLADDEESPWQTLRRDETMRAEISQDVERCLQENFFFREPSTKAKMLDILFIYSKLNPDLGYRQGMHELLAPILWVVDRDAISKESLEHGSLLEEKDALMLQSLDADYVEHDSFTLFCSIMQTARLYYEHKDQRSTTGQVDVAPIVQRCQYVHKELLMMTDQELADHLQAIEILPQIFLTRWMRLLFGREFPFDDVLTFWDLLFAEGLRSDLIDFVCIAMLLRIRWQLLEADYSTALSLLLRYPSPKPHPPRSFVHDGLYLEQNPTPERGKFIISKWSGKPPESPKRLNQGGVKPLVGRRAHIRSETRALSEDSSPARSPARNSPNSLEALFQDVSSGIQRRTESWGVAKAVRGAVSEARKNMQTIHSETNLRIPRAGSRSLLSSEDSTLIQDSKVAEIKTRVEHLEERNKMLARSLSQALNDLRSHMMNAQGLEGKTQDAIKQALCKVQSVQTCLEDSSAPVSTDESPKSNGEDLSDNSNIMEEKASVSAKEDKEQSSTDVEKMDAASKSPSQPFVEPGSRKHGTVKSVSAEAASPMPLRPTSRTSLTDSGFSWMLDGNRNLSGFVSSASVPPEQIRHQNPLFGNGEGNQRKPSNEPDGLALNSIRGPKRER